MASLVQSRTASARLPVVLCAPHGGNAVDGDQAETLLERPTDAASGKGKSGGGGSSSRHVNLVADMGTSQLLEEIDRRVTRKCSGVDLAAPAAVVARFHRKYIDANRRLEDGSAVAVHPCCARAKEVHGRYHRAIETAVGELLLLRCGEEEGLVDRARRRLLLLDVHGQHKYVDKVLIGTW